MRLPCVFVCAALAVTAAGAVARGQERSSRDPIIEGLVTDADAMPPEFAADALIRLSGSPRITQAAWRREILDMAFLRAYGAQDQYKRSALQFVPPDSRQGAQLLASTTSLTRLSLQVRATQLMTFVDPARARELFEWIDLNLEPGVCEDPLVPSVDEYFTALGLVARTSFGTDRGEALRFLQLYLWRAHLPSEMPAVVRALQRFRARFDEATYLEGFLRMLLEGASSDARGFSSATLDIMSRFEELQSSDRALGATGWHVMETLRTYLITQLKAPHCQDSITESLTPSTFNGALRRMKADFDVKPIDPDDVPPSKILGAARIDLYWQTPDARALHDAAQRLWGPGKEPVALRVRQTADWRNQAERLLNDLEQWAGKREAAERDYFYQKSVLFTALLDLMPPSAVRTRTVRAFVDFLRHADIDRDRHALWFAFLNRLLEMARAGDRRDILAALEDSHHPVLSLYGKLERMMPGSRK